MMPLNEFEKLVWKRMKRDEGATGLLCVDSEMIMEWHGGTGLLEELERDLNEFVEWDDHEKPLLAIVPTEYIESETQYGRGYGDVLYIPGYHLWEIVAEWEYEELWPELAEEHET